MSFIVCDNLVKIYKLLDDVEVLALQGLEMSVEHGEMVGIVGASGSGKTTLLNVLGGLVRPTAGTVLVDERPLLKLTNRELDRYRREEVGFVWQQGSRNLLPFMTARENVEYPLMLTGQAGREARRRASELLELVGLGQRADHRPSMLSGGEQQRVAIAIALANEPTLLLADEPTGELDSATSQLIYDLLGRLNRELKLTTLIVSHDPDIARHVDRVISIRDGKLAGETVRSAGQRRVVPTASDATERPEEGSDAPTEELFEELIVLDSAGRLQIPKELRAANKIGSRVRLEQTEDGVLIKPLEDQAKAENDPVAVQSTKNSAPASPKNKRGFPFFGRTKND